MPDKRIDQLPHVSTLGESADTRLMLFGNHLTGKLYKGEFIIDNNWKSPLSVSVGTIATGVAAGTTVFCQINGRAGNYAATEGESQFIISEDCSIKNLFVETFDAQPGTGSYVITVRLDGADTALSITIPAGSAGGSFSNLVNTVAIPAGGKICFKLTNNASTASARLNSIAATLIKTA